MVKKFPGAPGRTPYAFMLAARATCMANSVGCTRS